MLCVSTVHQQRLNTKANLCRLLWGAVLMLTATCFNSGTLLATRFFLGFLESAIGPGLTVIIAMWYSKFFVGSHLWQDRYANTVLPREI